MPGNYNQNNQPRQNSEIIKINLNSNDIYGETAYKLAEKIKKITNSQMRRIFNQLKDYKIKLNSGEKWETIYPSLQLSKAHIYYTIKRNNPKKNKDEWNSFEEIFNQCYSQVKTKEDFMKMATFFEALYAYYYYLSENINN